MGKLKKGLKKLSDRKDKAYVYEGIAGHEKDDADYHDKKIRKDIKKGKGVSRKDFDSWEDSAKASWGAEHEAKGHRKKLKTYDKLKKSYKKKKKKD